MDRQYTSLTGRWSGYFGYTNAAAPRVVFEAVLQETAGLVTGEIMEPNTFRSDINGDLLSAISGSRDGLEVSFLKTYTDFDEDDSPFYDGMVNRALSRIEGRWHFRRIRGWYGPFMMVRRPERSAQKSAVVETEMEHQDKE
ncbi:hypothetical protein [Aestuariibius sp. HNIBRBA575]|uniref:hypothetical protein n=1 Tax=Aestuariibius sp. HNIBRBA575 TaxID=3233343 RepID=UPI0034A5092A